MVRGVVQRMKDAREREKISREQMAVNLGVDFSTIGRWERHQAKDGPPLWAVSGYARATGEPVVALLGEDAPPEAIDAAIRRMLYDRLRRIDRDMDELQAHFAEFVAGSDA